MKRTAFLLFAVLSACNTPPNTDTTHSAIVSGSVLPAAHAIRGHTVVVRGPNIECSGTLIDNVHALTAAHCVTPFAPTEICFGARMNGQTQVCDGGTRPVVATLHHPSYDDETFAHDLAIVSFTGGIPGGYITIALRAANPINRQILTTAGYGNTELNGTNDGTLRRQTYVAQEVSIDATNGLFSSHNWASCQGDSGGPVLATIDNIVVQIGVTSRGTVPECNQGDDVSTSIAAHAAWIQTNSAAIVAAATPPAPCGIRIAGDRLDRGQSWTSCNGMHALVLQQSDGNLVLYSGSTPVWWQGPYNTAHYALMQPDGNFVLYTANDHPLWASGTAGNQQAFLAIRDDGRMSVNGLNFGPLWATCGMLESGQTLFSGQNKYSCDGRYRLSMQTDGNLVLYSPNRAIWSSQTFGSNYRLTMQTDGNLVILDGVGAPILPFYTHDHAGAFVEVQNDGNLVVYDTGDFPAVSSASALWFSGTSGQQ